MAGAKLGGILQFVADGKSYAIKGEVTWSTSGFSRETQMAQGQDPVAGHSRRPRAGKIAGTFYKVPGLKAQTLEDLENVKVQMRMYNGDKILGNPVSQTGDLEFDADEATFQMTLEGTVTQR